MSINKNVNKKEKISESSYNETKERKGIEINNDSIMFRNIYFLNILFILLLLFLLS